MDCGKTKVFMNEWKRMCKSYHTAEQAKNECKIHHIVENCGNCMDFVKHETGLAIKFVQEWSNAHPIKTRLDVLKEQYPNYIRNYEGLPEICASSLYGFDCPALNPALNTVTTAEICNKCWNTPIEQGVQL